MAKKSTTIARTIKPEAEKNATQDTEQRQIAEAAVASLERLGGSAFHEDDVIFEGKQIVLPESMTMRQSIEFLEMKEEELTVATDYSRVYNYKPWDVAFCAWQSMRRIFGAVGHNSSTVQTFFGPKKAPPKLIEIPINANETVSVPWGNFILPHLPEVIFSVGETNSKDYGSVGYLTAAGPKRWRHAIQGVFNLVQLELEQDSIYRGKPFDGQDNPRFLDLSMHNPTKMVYSENVMTQLKASLWGAIEYREEVKNLGIPFKRAILLAGSFGVGKSMAINETGRICEREGVTFILVRPGRDNLAQALTTARMYQPAVVAFEDVDVIADAEKDANRISEILDLFDGIEAKNTDVMLVLTTNHAERLHKGMLRPGRLDAIVEIGPPDAAGIRKLIEVNIGDSLTDDVDWSRVALSMEDYLPAFVVEAAHRALRYALVRNHGVLSGKVIVTDDLVSAGDGLRPQYMLMQEARDQVERATIDSAISDTMRNVALETAIQAHNWLHGEDYNVEQAVHEISRRSNA